MAVTAYASGTQNTTVPTEHFLANVNVAGTFTLHIDCVNMVAGDTIEVRIYQMVLTGSTARGCYVQRIEGAQHASDNVKISVPVSNELTDSQALRFSLNQTTGSTRAFYWKILKYA